MIKVTHKQLIAAAEAEITTLQASEAAALTNADDVLFVDIRDPRELQREGKIPGAFHVTRGMLEFWVDPTSPYYKEQLGSGKRLVFYCQSGWRSALATKTVQDMGMDNVCHIGGGFNAWKNSNAPVETVARR